MKLICAILFTGLISGMFASCKKQEPGAYDKEGIIYMPQAVGTRGNMSLLLLDTPQAIIFGAAYGGLSAPSTDINVTFKVDKSLIDSFNTVQQAAGNDPYVLFPDDAYTIDSLTATIRSGQLASNGLKIKFYTGKIDANTRYVLPLGITNTSWGTINDDLKTSFYTVTKLDNIYAGAYHATGTRNNYNADGSFASSADIDMTKNLTTIDAASSEVDAIANLAAGRSGSLFTIKVASDNTVTLSGYIDAETNPISTVEGTNTYDPATKTFTVHYKYVNANGTSRVMEETWVRQ